MRWDIELTKNSRQTMIMRTFIFLILIILFLESCTSTKSIGRQFHGAGIIQSCIEDTTVLFNAKTIKLSFDHKGNNLNSQGNNRSCENRPPFVDWFDDWPAMLILNVKEKTITYYYNFRPNEKNPDPKVITIISSQTKTGKIIYKKRGSSIEFDFPIDNWHKTFGLTYDKKSKLMTLVEK